jgi:hypothetical protein
MIEISIDSQESRLTSRYPWNSVLHFRLLLDSLSIPRETLSSGNDTHSPLLGQAAGSQLVSTSPYCSFRVTSHIAHIPGLGLSSVRDFEEREEISKRRWTNRGLFWSSGPTFPSLRYLNDDLHDPDMMEQYRFQYERRDNTTYWLLTGTKLTENTKRFAESPKLFRLHGARWGNLANMGLSSSRRPGFMISSVNCYA